MPVQSDNTQYLHSRNVRAKALDSTMAEVIETATVGGISNVARQKQQQVAYGLLEFMILRERSQLLQIRRALHLRHQAPQNNLMPLLQVSGQQFTNGKTHGSSEFK